MSNVLIDLKDIYFSYPKSSIFSLEKVNLKILKNDYLFIIGPNGGGKTTLIRIILGLLKASSGSISYFHPLRRELIGYIPQVKYYNYNFPIKVIDVILIGFLGKSKFFRSYSKEEIEKSLYFLELVKLESLKDKYIFELSGGQLQRVFLARALVQSPILLVLDEPTTFLDSQGINILSQILDGLNKKNISIIFVTHDMSIVLQSAKKIIHINQKINYDKYSIKDFR